MDSSYHVHITRQAEDQLREIVQYIYVTLQSPQAASNTLDALDTEIMALSTMPKRFPVIEDDPAGDRGIRKTLVNNFYVYYLVADEERIVHVLAICYARRNQKQVLEGIF